ncbi:MAG: hypothetical protein LZF60_120036 [Nitrospira sp.]|nr:MAG: hypothetical protein LZF60_120036 [Nitrospira sp.]
MERPYKPDSVPHEACAHTGVIISLGLELPRASSNLPGDFGRAGLSAELLRALGRLPIWSCSGRRLPCR